MALIEIYGRWQQRENVERSIPYLTLAGQGRPYKFSEHQGISVL